MSLLELSKLTYLRSLPIVYSLASMRCIGYGMVNVVNIVLNAMISVTAMVAPDAKCSG